ncbi:hypothetical protein [Cecembia rubra]|uniref:hypothetical protein n=1 Tax=Cecembia rubra TaxID=1485585 RepID=UPI002714922D|nr:hypothetical protein [Cecembia rubra]
MKMDIRLIWVNLFMQESWKLRIDEHTGPTYTKASLLQLLESNTKELGIFLSYYFKKQGAVAENVTLSNPPVFTEKLTGKLQVEFDLVFFNACLNIHENEKEQMELTFKIIPEDAQLILTGPYWPEREMDEI